MAARHHCGVCSSFWLEQPSDGFDRVALPESTRQGHLRYGVLGLEIPPDFGPKQTEYALA